MLICICEDEEVFLNAISSAVIKWAQKQTELCNIKTYRHAEALLFDLDSGYQFDLFLLDIELPVLNGIELATKIRKSDKLTPIVFVTSFSKYSIQGYSVSAYRFILKPIRDNQIFECLEYAKKLQSLQPSPVFSFHSNKIYYRIPLKYILYISAENHSAHLYTNEPAEYYFTINKSLDEVIVKSCSGLLVRCHRGYIVNILNVRQYSSRKIILMDRSEIPVGRKYSSITLSLLNKYFFDEKSI